MSSPTSILFHHLFQALATDGAIPTADASLSEGELDRLFKPLREQVNDSLKRQEDLLSNIQRNTNIFFPPPFLSIFIQIFFFDFFQFLFQIDLTRMFLLDFYLHLLLHFPLPPFLICCCWHFLQLSSDASQRLPCISHHWRSGGIQSVAKRSQFRVYDNNFQEKSENKAKKKNDDDDDNN